MSHFYERIDNTTLNYGYEISKILFLLNEKYGSLSAMSIIDEYCFRKLRLSGNFISIESMLDDIMEDDIDSSDKFVYVSEVILSLREQINSSIISSGFESRYLWKQLNALKNLIEYDLNKLNLEYKIIENNYGKIASIGPKNELLETAIDNIKESNIESQLIVYNSVSAKGNIKEKENILCSIYSFVEAYLKNPQLLQMNRRLFDNVDFLYNNLNMKHNNKECNDTFFYEKTLNEREKWLDNLFHNVLLVLSSKRECEINSSICELKKAKGTNNEE